MDGMGEMVFFLACCEVGGCHFIEGVSTSLATCISNWARGRKVSWDRLCNIKDLF